MLDKYHDITFLFIFLLHLAIIFSIAFTYGSVALTHIGAGSAIVSRTGALNYYLPTNRQESIKLLVGSFLAISVSVSLSISWIFFLSKFALYFITSLITSIIFLTIIFATICISLGYIVVGILMIAFALVILISSLFFRPRIDFAAANLRVACVAILSCPSTLVSSVIVQFLQGLFIIIWTAAFYGIATNNDQTVVQSLRNNLTFNINQCITYKYSNLLYIDNNLTLQCHDSNSQCQACVCGGALLSDEACFSARLYTYGYVCMLFSLVWTCGVCASVVQCTTAYIVSKWWNGKSVDEDGTTVESEGNLVDGEICQMSWCSTVITKSGLTRSLTTSLGSLCFGTLLVAIVRSIRTVLRLILKQTKTLSSQSSSVPTAPNTVVRGSCLMAVLTYALKLVDKAMTYFNRYAFCYVGVHGESFIKASKSVMDLFRRKGWLNIIINDDIIDFVLIVSNVAIGLLTMMTCYYYSQLSEMESGLNVSLLTMLGFLSGYFASKTTLSIISSAVSTIYICYGECPEIFKV